MEFAMIYLSDHERAILRAQHKRERDKRICDRIKAVSLFDKKWSLHQLLKLFCFPKMRFVNTFPNSESLIEEFEDFRSAVFGFFSALPMLDPDSVLGQTFRSRVRDKFRPINSPIKASAWIFQPQSSRSSLINFNVKWLKEGIRRFKAKFLLSVLCELSGKKFLDLPIFELFSVK